MAAVTTSASSKYSSCRLLCVPATWRPSCQMPPSLPPSLPAATSFPVIPISGPSPPTCSPLPQFPHQSCGVVQFRLNLPWPSRICSVSLIQSDDSLLKPFQSKFKWSVCLPGSDLGLCWFKGTYFCFCFSSLRSVSYRCIWRIFKQKNMLLVVPPFIPWLCDITLS